MNTDKRFNSRKFGRCEILITFQWSGSDDWNVGLRRTYAQNGLYMVFNTSEYKIIKFVFLNNCPNEKAASLSLRAMDTPVIHAYNT